MVSSAAVINRLSKEENRRIYGIDEFFTKENFELLKGIMYPKRSKAGSVLFWEGEETGKLYYIRSGIIKLKKTTEEGKDLILSILRQGDLLGEIGTHDVTFHNYSAEVMEDAEFGVVQQKDLEVLLYRHGNLAIEFMMWMGLMQRATESKFRDLLLFGKPGALASTLIRLSNTYGIERTDGIYLEIRLTNTEIADLIGTARESVNRMLSTLKTEGTIGMVNGHIVIYHLDRLRRVCCCPSSPSCPKGICRI